MGEESLSLHAASALAEAFEESDLPFKVNVVDWARIDRGLRRIVRRHGVAVQAPTELPTRLFLYDDYCQPREVRIRRVISGSGVSV